MPNGGLTDLIADRLGDRHLNCADARFVRLPYPRDCWNGLRVRFREGLRAAVSVENNRMKGKRNIPGLQASVH